MLSGEPISLFGTAGVFCAMICLFSPAICLLDSELATWLIFVLRGTIQGIFDRYDRDRSGKIDSRELTEALRSLGYVVPPSVIELLITNYNNGVPRNGALDFDNFVE